MEKVIDISYHQGSVDFAQVKSAGIESIILREGYGNVADQRFFEYVKKAKAAGIKILGVYHFSYALNEKGAKKEAQVCIKNLEEAKLNKDVMVFYDFEYDTVKQAAKKRVYLKSADCNRHTAVFCEEIKKLGFTPGVYANLDFYKNWYSKDVLSKYYFWLADYSGKPDVDCLMHQYSSKGRIPGIKGNVDLNHYYREKFKIKDKNTDSKKPSPSYKLKEVKTTCYARNKDVSIAGIYITISNVYCRNDAGQNKKILCSIPKGTKVKNYGFYTTVNGVKWLLIQFVLDGVQYTGFTSSKYLKK